MKGQHIVNYLRQTQSGQALRLALSEIAGLEITKTDSILENSYVNGQHTVYNFEDGSSYRVNYPHTALVLGNEYPRNTVIGGEYIRVHTSEDNSNEQWWRKLDWSDGLPLSGPWEGLTIPDGQTKFYWVSDWTDSEGNTRKHIRADFDNSDTTLQDRFWYQAHQAEERMERTLVDTDALSTVDNGTDVTINMLDFYFRELYGNRGVVVDLQTEDLGNKKHEAVLHFLRRETPVGAIRILRVGGQLSADFS